jgi:hypothetical protein
MYFISPQVGGNRGKEGHEFTIPGAGKKQAHETGLTVQRGKHGKAVIPLQQKSEQADPGRRYK